MNGWEAWLNDWIYVITVIFLVVELVRYVAVKRLNWTLVGDTLTNFVTFGAFILVSYVTLFALYLAAYTYFSQFAIWTIDVNWATVLLCVVAADLCYYWEHRFTHRVGIAWASHTVHHSSPNMNVSVAYRFGPLDGLWPIPFHIPLVLVGFNPFVVFFAEAFVQLYQTVLHTEVIKKLPRPIEWLMNTPSHHRVHHGANREYIDKNYSGIFIIWDRIFGTFAEEKAAVQFGITKPLNSVNPLVVFFHGLYRLGEEFAKANGWRAKWQVLVGPPGQTEVRSSVPVNSRTAGESL
ncbi:MAG: sterol desaturase family protein [Pseudomonadota bacterium]